MKAIFVFLAIFFSMPTLAEQTFAAQMYVYRVDARPPDNIFTEGFQSFGNNRNL